jgi:hypothetical protein
MLSRNEIEEILGRPLEVEQTRDGKYIVLYMNFGCSPPPKGCTPEDAIEKFITYWSTHEARIRPALPDSEDAEGPKGA